MDAIRIEIDIPDIRRIIQWKIVNHFTLVTIFKQIGHMVQIIEIQVVIVIFVENKYIRPKDMTNAVDKYFFVCLPMV